MDVPALSMDESLVRAFFCPEQHDGSVFLNNAVSLDDLKERGFSVDRPLLTPMSVLLHRLRTQRASNPTQREQPKFSELFYEKLLNDTDTDTGKPLFEVLVTPVELSDKGPENRGHASVFSADRSLGRGGLRKIRTALLIHLNNIVELGTLPYIGDADPQEIFN